MKHTFILEDVEDKAKPLPCTLKRKRPERVEIPSTYPKFEVEFYDVLKSCAEYIDKIQNTDDRIRYNKLLNKIFILRHRGSAMKLFRELVYLNAQPKGGDSHGQKS